ncbi:MAG: hypothetical protein NDP13_02690 [Crenarchaeota archaeon]|nr:hypothetical protein [Thermoproteota archaeon]MCR8453874.1 hypothetical protein [Thermoproteota archaeon]MCR8455307.1 hypothetical protein [Thermoproteota archaeon]MCR8462577.1 hypothetical protein [Thermoproteota archaeon]MCR8470695.1 hypothetical protein [Thermoproteota archaeon]
MESMSKDAMLAYHEVDLKTRRTIQPELGDLALGQVVNVGDKIATLLISMIFRIQREGELNRLVILRPPPPTHANIFKGDVSFPCVNLVDIIKTGDIILGRVKIAWFKPIFMSLDTEETGVVSGLCSNCGLVIPTPCDLSKQTLICPRCGGSRKTKISKLYNPMLWREIYHINRVRTLPPL